VRCCVAAVLLVLALAFGAAAHPCAGDCDGDGRVMAAEIARVLAAIFGRSGCPAADADGSGTITAADLLGAVRVQLDGGCLAPTATAMPMPSPSPTPTAIGTPASRWIALPPLPQGPRQEVAVAALDGRILVIGGLTDAGRGSAAVEVYDPVAGEWGLAAALPAARHHVGAATLAGSVYAIGGFRGSSFVPDADGYRYEAPAEGWAAVAPLPRARGALAVAPLDGRLHALGGSAVGGSVADHTIYDPTADQWTTAAPLPSPRNHLAAVVVGGALYAIGGRSDGGGNANSAALERYDPARDAWDGLTPMPTARSGHAAAEIGGRLVVMGGEVNPGRPDGVFVEVELYDPASDRWTVIEPMPVPRHGIGAVAVAALVYVPGGATRAGFGATAHADALRLD
jgi:N-acetylneuraminic acid mutarotase